MAAEVQTDTRARVVAALVRMGLAGTRERLHFERLTGGVSSDIWRVDRPGRDPICVKQAAPRLRVAADWQAPVERNVFEAAWLRRADQAVPGIAPLLLGQDTEAGLLAMQFLAPAEHPVWKDQLVAGAVDETTAGAVADRLVTVHAATANRSEIAAEFESDHIFWSIRLEPYLIATGAAHPALMPRLRRLAETTASHKIALVHGDVSPKNILVGPSGPVFVDAECAWFGDPAFDLAFCLNHLLLKCFPAPAVATRLLACFSLVVSRYLDRVRWEPSADLERRAAHLLPALTLARIDGKSPVEYITDRVEKDRVRLFATRLINSPVDRLGDIKESWREALNRV